VVAADQATGSWLGLVECGGHDQRSDGVWVGRPVELEHCSPTGQRLDIGSGPHTGMVLLTLPARRF
jgi:hypothetical protein